MKIKNQLTLIAILFSTILLLAACGGNKISGTWVQYAEKTEKDKIIWTIDLKKDKLTVTNYSNDEKDESAIINIQLDKNKDVLSQTRSNGQIDDLPFSIEKDVLTIHAQTFYREGSKADKDAKEKAKNAREEDEVQDKKNKETAKEQQKKEEEKQEKLKSDEEDYNKAVDQLQERINDDFKENYSGEWFAGKGFDEKNIAVYQSASATKLVLKDGNLSTQTSFVKIGDEHESNKEEAHQYNFVGIQLPHSFNYTEPEEDQAYNTSNIVLPDSVSAIDKIETISDLAKYQEENNGKELYFKCQSTDYKGSSTSLVLNVYKLEELHLSGAIKNYSFIRDVPNKFEATDFDI
ncbi:hypothetical protein SAMN04487774_10837 [Enterococcus faecalis]|uniref:hypothetical protein n=1 Tax=Enterococcus faecalis TaxID=1351 RepID=UPI00045A79AE|nr:hypothetical protein [Enterococcus faecalis]KAJ79741.1 hypothetical protein P788_1096 [Enterococcus faecalis MTUP9]SDN75967.1 hypothetical protein SAMN04487774_10837 [Enterococcus faecalis]